MKTTKNKESWALHRYFPFITIFCFLTICLGSILITPPFEGFDEYNHYSSIKQLADTGSIPVYGLSFVDKQISAYTGPRAYGNGEPPYDTGLTYSKFFQDKDAIAEFESKYRKSNLNKKFENSETLNTGAQHPPLYYLLLTPIYKITSNFSIVDRLIILRFSSVLIACAGLIFTFLGVYKYVDLEYRKYILLGIAIYPTLLPMLTPEFARLGNDSLCLMLCGILFYCISRWDSGKKNYFDAIVIGGLLGLGLITKAFFVPISVAIILYMSVVSIIQRNYKDLLKILGLTITASFIGLFWYYKLYEVNSTFEIGDEAIRLSREGGIRALDFSGTTLMAVFRGALVIIATWSWAGTWSLVRLPTLMQAPLVLGAVWLLVKYIPKAMRDYKSMLPLILLIMVGGGLMYHTLVSLALGGNGSTPGWYLHILFPWVAIIFGLSVIDITKNGGLERITFGLLLIYSFFFQIAAYWTQFSLYTGCASKNLQKGYDFSSPAFCLLEISKLTDRITIFGAPKYSLIFIVIGLGMAAVNLALAWRYCPVSQEQYQFIDIDDDDQASSDKGSRRTMRA